MALLYAAIGRGTLLCAVIGCHAYFKRATQFYEGRQQARYTLANHRLTAWPCRNSLSWET